MLLVVICLEVWTIGFTFEIAATDLDLKVALANLQFAGIDTLPVAWLALTLTYTGQLRPRNWLVVGLLGVVGIDQLVIWTNPWHHLFRGEPSLDTSQASFAILDNHYSLWYYWVQIPFVNLIFLGSLVFLLYTLRFSSGVHRKQIVCLLLSTIVPLLLNALYVFGFSPIPHLNLSAVGFTTSAMLLSWSLIHYEFLDLMPVARNVLVDHFKDAWLVFDNSWRAVELYCQQALALEPAQLNPFLAQPFLLTLGMSERERGRADKALYYLAQAQQAIGNDQTLHSSGIILNYQGLVYRLVGQYELARRYFEQALSFYEHSALFDQMYCLSYLGMLFHLEGQQDQALEYCHKALALAGRVQLVKLECDTLTRLARVQLALQRFDEAAQHCERALELGRERAYPDTIIDGLATLIEIWLAQGGYSRAILKEKLDELSEWLASSKQQVGVAERFRPYLIVYRARLELGQLPEAEEWLAVSCKELMEIASGIEDENLRCSFLKRTDVHAELLEIRANTMPKFLC